MQRSGFAQFRYPAGTGASSVWVEDVAFPMHSPKRAGVAGVLANLSAQAGDADVDRAVAMGERPAVGELGELRAA